MKKSINVIIIAILALSFSVPAFAQEDKSTTPGKVDFKKLKSPVPYTKKSIKRGKMWFSRECTACHGPDGKAQIDIIANATDLTKTKMWYSGFSEGEIYRSIRDGAGEAMPPYKSKIRKDEDLWHLVNFVRSLWPKDQQPKLVEDKPKTTESATDETASSTGE
jgi:mono/diheme cytochrome c family protein